MWCSFVFFILERTIKPNCQIINANLFLSEIKSEVYKKLFIMPTEQYHEPASELSDATRTFARMITSLIEEADAINWYEQRISIEKDKDAKAIMEHAQNEEFIHFSMDLEFLSRKKEKWRTILKNILFKHGDIVENAEKAEDKIEE
jgi:hypothetical protein